MDTLPESDRLLDFPHPRETEILIGQDDAERHLLDNITSGKLHHAWILGGPRGIGKATLAYRAARFVLKHGGKGRIDERPPTLQVDASDAVFKRVAAGAHGGLFSVRRAYDPKSKRIRRDISVDDIRKAAHFFSRTSGEGGWRICIIDAADDMNRPSANALLKILEEPPARSLFFLVSHAPMRLLATLRSRCVSLNMKPLSVEAFTQTLTQNLTPEERPDSVALTSLHAISEGSPGRAMDLVRGGGWQTFRKFQGLLDDATGLKRQDTTAFVDALSARGAEQDYAAFCELMLQWLARTVRDAACGGSKPQSPVNMSPDKLAEAWQQIAHSIDRSNALNLDRKQTLLQALNLLKGKAA